MYKKPQISSVEYEQTLSQWIQREKDRKIIKS